jgi:hypothetical protein
MSSNKQIFFYFFPDVARQCPNPPLSYKYLATRKWQSRRCKAFICDWLGRRRQTLKVTVRQDPCICNSPTSGWPVERRTALTLLGLQRLSRQAIRLNVLTVLAGKYRANTFSYLGQLPAASTRFGAATMETASMAVNSKRRIWGLSSGGKTLANV